MSLSAICAVLVDHEVYTSEDIAFMIPCLAL